MAEAQRVAGAGEARGLEQSVCGYGVRSSHVGIGDCVGSGVLDDGDVRCGSLVGFENSEEL